MQDAKPSRTALAAAMHRAAHQMLEQGAIFRDPLALDILDPVARDKLAAWAGLPGNKGMRLFIAARSRFAEDSLASALARGTRQIVVVGAGLDTLALRRPDDGATLYEVDHPATQAWKRERLAAAGLALPGTARLVAVDFERQDLGSRLKAAGFDARAPAFFIWLGVVPYLSLAAIDATLALVAGIAGGEIVFDYANPPDQLAPAYKAQHARRAARAAASGEPWITYFDTGALRERLLQLGASEIEDRGPSALLGRPGDDHGGHVVRVRWSR